MIIKPDGNIETHNKITDRDWYNENNYVIDETKKENQELVEKIENSAPYMELVVKGDRLVDVIPLPRPEPEPLPPQLPTDKERIESLEEALILLLMEG